MKLYSELAEWWPLISPREEYEGEADRYWGLMSAGARRPIRTALELGSGGGHAASYLKAHAAMTLLDLSEEMQGVSRRLNPECEHVKGDMRTARLGREFDAVFVHDAVMHMCSEEDLLATMRTAREHCAGGGVALFVPDCTRERWSPETRTGGVDAAGADADGCGRGARYLSWTWDPDPADNEYVLDMVYALRDEHGRLRVEQDRARLGLFAQETWMRLLRTAGFAVRVDSGSGPGEPTAFAGLCEGS